MTRRLLLGGVALCGLAALYLGFAPPPEVRIARFVAYALPIVLVALALAVGAALVALRASFAAGIRPARDDVVAALALAGAMAALALVFPGKMRIQADEYLVAGAALGIWQRGTPEVVAGAVVTPGGALEPNAVLTDKRGLAYPLALALAFGRGPPDWTRGLALNLAFGWTALLGLYALLRTRLAPPVALAGALLLAASPVFAWACRSLLIEPLNLALLGATAALAVAAARSRRTDLALLLGLLAPLLAQARYESALAAALAYGGALALLSATPRPRAAALLLVPVPLLFLPFAWQRAVDFSHGLDQIGAVDAFSLAHLRANLPIAAGFFARPSPYNPVAPALAALALLGAWRVARERTRSRAETLVLVALCAFVFAATVVVLSYAWGDLTNVITARLGLPAVFLVCAAAGVGLGAVTARVAHGGALALALAGAALAYALPATNAETLFDGAQTGHPLNRASALLRHGYPRCRPLVVSAYGPYFLAYGYSATTTDYLTQHWAELVPRLGGPGLDTVLFVELRDLQHDRLLPNNTVPEALIGRVVHEEDVTPETALRIFELRRRDDERARAPIAGCP